MDMEEGGERDRDGNGWMEGGEEKEKATAMEEE